MSAAALLQMLHEFLNIVINHSKLGSPSEEKPPAYTATHGIAPVWHNSSHTTAECCSTELAMLLKCDCVLLRVCTQDTVRHACSVHLVCYLQILFQGPHVKMGVYRGRPTGVSPHVTTGRADYFGPFVNRCGLHLRVTSP